MIEIQKSDLHHLYIDKRKTLQEIANKYNCSCDTILKRLRKYKIKTRNKSDYTKYSCDRHFFNNITLENSYWAGFIAADGCILKHGRAIRIELKRDDKKILERFKKVTQYTGPINDVNKKGFGKIYPQCNITIFGAQLWVNDLERNFNVTKHKSTQLIPPYLLNDEQALAYIIGFIDGDGCIGLYKEKQKSKPFLDFKICGQPLILEWIASTLNKFEDNQYNIVTIRLNSQKTIYEIHYKRIRAYKILSKLLEVNIPFKLGRKWCKVLEYGYIHEKNIS